MSAVRFTGKVKSWNDDRGFDFIAPTEGGQDIFVHVSECPKDGRPELQEMLTFEVALNAEGRRRR
jgi:cold shock CspA family protein